MQDEDIDCSSGENGSQWDWTSISYMTCSSIIEWTDYRKNFNIAAAARIAETQNRLGQQHSVLQQ